MSDNEAPSVEVEEVTSLAESIEGVETSIVAFIGGSVQGPYLNRPW